MTTLDQSFIKAYSLDEPVALAPSPAPRTAPKPAPNPVPRAFRPTAAGVRFDPAATPTPHASFAARIGTAMEEALADAQHVDRSAVYAAWTTSLNTLDAAAVEESTFQPRLEVDQFAWPRVVEDLSEQHAAAFAAAIDELVAAAVGERVVAMVGERRQAGATTAALVAARWIARRGLNVVLVDANFLRPALAERLGLAVQKGWDDVLAGRAELADVLVHSLADQLTLLPIAGPSACEAPPVDDVQPAATIATLRHYFDLVLLDTGALADGPSLPKAGCAARGAAGATIVVRDVRHASGEKVPAGTIGVIENFARAA
jgi:Mrp family chromosome partitioning ATPase